MEEVLQVKQQEVNLYQGNLNFYHNREIIETVIYKSNRAILFPAHMIHGAEAPTGKEQLRVSLAYKFYM